MDALHRRAIAAGRRGDLDEAIALYEQVVRARPDFPEAHNNLGIALGQAGRVVQSCAAYRDALRHRPDYAEAHNNLGIVLARQGKVEESLDHFEAALRVRPEYPEAYNNLGNSLRNLGRIDAAIECYRSALAQRPTYPEAHNNLGNALSEKERFDEAVVCYHQALRLNPSYFEAHNNLGNTLARLQRINDAIDSYRRALRLNPDYSEAYNNLGNALADDGQLAEAVACYREALRLNPDYAEAFNNLGITLGKQRKYSEANDCYSDALRRRPDYADARMNRALGWLQAGRFEQGWPEYEWRWRAKGVDRPNFLQPAWQGERLDGRTILLYSEQGLGDTFQFIRYAPMVKRRGGVVVFECQPQLVPMLSRCPGIDRLVPKGSALPEFQTHCALLSLPAALRTTLATIPSETPYLFADPALVARWRRELDALGGVRIGINWQGNPQYKGDRHRSIPLDCFAPLAELPGARLISLQKGLGTEQLAASGDRLGIVDLGNQLDEAAGAFMDSAAVLTNLDAFVTSDTAIAHLAGALGVPTYLALSWTADWRWLDGRLDCPWYPTFRLFRQPEPGDWNTVFRRIADELRLTLETPSDSRAILVPLSAGELVDRLTIVETDAAQARDSEDRGTRHAELVALQDVFARSVEGTPALESVVAELRSVNARLRQIENQLHACEQTGDFGPDFIALAREHARERGHRDGLKRQVDQLHRNRRVSN